MADDLHITSRQQLIEYLDAIGSASGVKRVKYLCFWGHQPNRDGSIGKTCLSQWFEASFEIDGVQYPTAEHFMMAGKARLFDDNDALEKILAAGHPGEAKKLGRLVRNFDGRIWGEARFEIVVEANVAKFSQNEKLKTFLLGTGKRVLVEASPRDRIWGIGLGRKNPDAENPHNWRGENLLGFALMEARRRIAL